MIAPLNAPNEFGLISKHWHYISKFSKRSNVPPEERLRIAIAEANAYANPHGRLASSIRDSRTLRSIAAPDEAEPSVWELVRLGIFDEYGPRLER